MLLFKQFYRRFWLSSFNVGRRLAILRWKFWKAFRYPSNLALRIPTHLTLEEKEVLFFLSSSLPKQAVCLEIGSYLGASARLIAEGGNSTLVHCVDTWYNDAMSVTRNDTYAEFLRNTSDLKERIIPHRGWSIEIAEDFKVPLDLLFVDGDHSYKAVSEDLKAWTPYLKPGGWLVLHDIGWAFGVKKAYEEFTRSHRCQYTMGLPNMMLCQLRKP